MVNWHRMVSPLRSLQPPPGAPMDVFQLIFDICANFEVRYEPVMAAPSPMFPPRRNGTRRSLAIFVDSLDHTSGVATTIRQWGEMADRQGRDMRIYYCGDQDLMPSGYRFGPVGKLRLGCYKGLVLQMPCVSDVFRHFMEDPADVVHLSTPGPMGLLGLVAARRCGSRLVGTYHTDFPAYAVSLTGNFHVEQAAWRFMRWFYGQLDRVATPSHDTLRNLAAHGFAESRLRVVGRGIRQDLFSPEFRDPGVRDAWQRSAGRPISHWLLYVGRVSREKNLSCLAGAFKLLCQSRNDVGLVVTGDGPYLDELKTELAALPAVFTGVQKKETLARTYASADLFVFPSETDTLGVVLLEAQASGLPVLVSDSGGPKDCMVPGVTGEIVKPMNATLLARAASGLLSNRKWMQDAAYAARRHARQHTPERSFDAFWSLHEWPESQRASPEHCMAGEEQP